MAASNKWVQLTGMEESIKAMTYRGVSPSQNRRELIKYLSLWSASPNCSSNDVLILRDEMAYTYEKLGDYKMAAREFSRRVSLSPDVFVLHSLAFQYERVGDRDSALQLYSFMAESFTNGGVGNYIGVTGVACLGGFTNRCVLKNPDWWGEYRGQPEWWGEVHFTFPKVDCFEDGYEYIVHNIWKKQDPKILVKAWAELLEFKPTTFIERERVLLSISHAYSEVGDHHRAIESAWQILARFPGDIEYATLALKFIASEFEKLGEREQARDIEKMLACFTEAGKELDNAFTD